MSHQDLSSINDLKAKAKRLRSALAETGHPISHSQSLEALAKQLGFRDWNTLFAAAGNTNMMPPVALGQIVTGFYLGKPIKGEIHALSALGDGRYRVTIDLEDAVDVVDFDSFSSFRRRLKANIQKNGETIEKTSNGSPQLRLSL